MEEAEDYLTEILPFIETKCPDPNTGGIATQEGSNAVVECIGAIIKWASNMKQEDRFLEVSLFQLHSGHKINHYFQVLRSVRTGVSYQFVWRM